VATSDGAQLKGMQRHMTKAHAEVFAVMDREESPRVGNAPGDPVGFGELGDDAVYRELVTLGKRSWSARSAATKLSPRLLSRMRQSTQPPLRWWPTTATAVH
jgi:hypothetical protein